ncbi:DUF397 domain-containing protein [Streptomyces bobili]|uniref:DUF397 domain-containing protein n=1 Tax=Streptomyces bobili TaxID=67280 RepID=UPI002250C21D|nr:DUF397 domain-containing protein [Streptomyces bobili]MCX5526635.1 DUF397 domain-containing protein [Streptomyces bobili]
MQTLHWQKSTYSGDGSNCVYIATGTTDTLHIRESDRPDVILTMKATGIQALVCGVKVNPGLLGD